MIGRPQPAEAAPYYFAYINQVTGDNPVTAIESQLEESPAFFASISEDKSLYRYAPEKWSIRQLLNHVTDSERAFGFRALWFARGFESPLPSYDQNIAAASAQADTIFWAAHIEEFAVSASPPSRFSEICRLRRGCAAASPATIASRCTPWRISSPGI
jgi:hypothetical protein